MYCPNCGHSVPDNADFCPNCGTRINKRKQEKPKKQIQFCPKCGQKISENTVFCPNCGARIENNSAGQLLRNERTTFDSYAARTPQKRRKKRWLVCTIAAALIVCLVVGLVVRRPNNGYRKGVENTVDFINKCFYVEDPDEIDSNYIKEMLKLILPKSIVDNSADMIEITTRAMASEEAVSQEEELQALLLKDHQLNAPIKLRKIESATKLKKSELEKYQNQINNDFSHLVEDLLGVSDNSDDLSEYADDWGISEDDAQELHDELISISEKTKKMKVTNGYKVKFSYLSDEDKIEILTIDFLYIDKTWVPAVG